MLKEWINRNFGRTEKFKKLSLEMDMSFSEKDEWGLLNLLKGFQLFHKGDITNILKEKEGFYDSDIRIFDYKYTKGSGDSSSTHKQTVFFIQSKKLNLPEFYLKPEYFLYRIGKYFGIKDIDFQEHPEFSKQYWLKGTDEARIRKEINEEVIHFFTIEKNWSLEGINYYMILYKKDTLLLPEEVKELYEKGKELVTLFVSDS